MKRAGAILIVFMILGSCVSGTVGYTDPQEVVDTWARGLREKNLKLLMSTYWQDAETAIQGEGGSWQVFSGSSEIEKMQRGTTDNPDIQLNIWTHTAELKVRGDKATCDIKVEAGELVITNILELEKRDGRWAITRQVLK